jgi:stage II sporulation protein AB (anti-sigma F factor)
MENTNEMELIFDACSRNESFARVTAAAFLTQLNPTLEEVADVKTAISEAVTNCIIHGYDGGAGKIHMKCRLEDDEFAVEISDDGCGIADVRKAMEPMYTTRAELERSGMGFSFMEAFMDSLEVESKAGEGTVVRMKKIINRGRNAWTTQSL